MPLSLIAGLGNPGAEYEGSRHNVGFWLIDFLAKELGGQWVLNKKQKALIAKVNYNGEVIYLVKPQAYMNLSGETLQKVCSYYKISPNSMIVVFDDINIEQGEFKISQDKGPGGHNGVSNIIEHCGSNFTQFRLGIGSKAYSEQELKDHVLGKITAEEKSVLTSRLPEYINGLKYLLEKGPVMAMNLLNKRDRNERRSN